MELMRLLRCAKCGRVPPSPSLSIRTVHSGGGRCQVGTSPLSLQPEDPGGCPAPRGAPQQPVRGRWEEAPATAPPCSTPTSCGGGGGGGLGEGNPPFQNLNPLRERVAIFPSCQQPISGTQNHRQRFPTATPRKSKSPTTPARLCGTGRHPGPQLLESWALQPGSGPGLPARSQQDLSSPAQP